MFKTTDKSEFKKVALQYSKKLDIVESPEFANLTHEEGQGGNTWDKTGVQLRVKPEQRARGLTHTKSKQPEIYGVLYDSVRIASDILNIHHTTISYRCRSIHFPNYKYIIP